MLEDPLLVLTFKSEWSNRANTTYGC